MSVGLADDLARNVVIGVQHFATIHGRKGLTTHEVIKDDFRAAVDRDPRAVSVSGIRGASTLEALDPLVGLHEGILVDAPATCERADELNT